MNDQMKEIVTRSFFPGNKIHLKKWQAWILDSFLLAVVVGIISLFIGVGDYIYAIGLCFIFLFGFFVGKYL